MRLTLAYHPVSELSFGDTTHLDGTRLLVDQEALRQHLLADRRLASVDFHVVRPGDSCRFGVVFDILEPRAKAPGAGPDFPGILGPIDMVGQGLTHVLHGAAVTVLDEGAPLAGGKIVEMSGASREGMSLRLPIASGSGAAPGAGLRTAHRVARAPPGVSEGAVYLAGAAVGQEAAATESIRHFRAGPLWSRGSTTDCLYWADSFPPAGGRSR